LIHPAIWPQQTWAENSGAVPLWGGGARSPSNNVAKAYLRAKFHLDPSNRLATVHERYRQTYRQRSGSIGRTVLQTVAEKNDRLGISGPSPSNDADVDGGTRHGWLRGRWRCILCVRDFSHIAYHFITARSELRKVLFLALLLFSLAPFQTNFFNIPAAS